MKLVNDINKWPGKPNRLTLQKAPLKAQYRRFYGINKQRQVHIMLSVYLLLGRYSDVLAPNLRPARSLMVTLLSYTSEILASHLAKPLVFTLPAL